MVCGEAARSEQLRFTDLRVVNRRQLCPLPKLSADLGTGAVDES